ncbi:hypothetical protein CALCODRAFT_506421 [Calocera cornea HHB12733]|uniref:DUF6532 domain-containing protein n=1 Tax=Calocera cornea HHB12733 TaxID=1353952 RepID=A0A165J0P3_9BASI|nr:hypothetical protein CALCODRAFT_506421 [Calocera cornea HHB12733]
MKLSSARFTPTNARHLQAEVDDLAERCLMEQSSDYGLFLAPSQHLSCGMALLRAQNKPRARHLLWRLRPNIEYGGYSSSAGPYTVLSHHLRETVQSASQESTLRDCSWVDRLASWAFPSECCCLGTFFLLISVATNMEPSNIGTKRRFSFLPSPLPSQDVASSAKRTRTASIPHVPSPVNDATEVSLDLHEAQSHSSDDLLIIPRRDTIHLEGYVPTMSFAVSPVSRTLQYYRLQVRVYVAMRNGCVTSDELSFVIPELVSEANDELADARLPSFHLPLPTDIFEDLAQTVGHFRNQVLEIARLAVLETYQFNDVTLWANRTEIRKYLSLLLTPGKGLYTFKHFDNRFPERSSAHSGIFENPAWVALTSMLYYDRTSSVGDACTRPDLFLGYTMEFVAFNFAALHHALQEWLHGFFSPTPLDEAAFRVEYLWLLRSLIHWSDLTQLNGSERISQLLARLRNDVMDKVTLTSATDPTVIQCTWVDRYV